MVADMKVYMVANIQVDKVADMVADIEADKKKIGRHVVAHGGRHVVAHGHHMVANKVAAMVQILIAFEYFTKLKKWIHLFLVIRFAFHFTSKIPTILL